jgi:SP family general alpha glucoside:H+ symporter-like MFS transporter
MHELEDADVIEKAADIEHERIPDFARTPSSSQEAQTAPSIWETVLQYKAAILWSAFIGLAGINWWIEMLVSALSAFTSMDADVWPLSNGVISVPSFHRDFGYRFENKYIISASWQIAFNTTASTGSCLGAIVAEYLADKIGKR